jgi:hypothetical protein
VSTQLYGVVGRGNPSKPGKLLNIDTGTGAGSLVGNLGFNSAGGLAYDPNTDTLYGVTFTSTVELATINTATGQATVVGPLDLGTDQAVFGLAFDPDTNTLYGKVLGPAQLITIDPATGAATAVGALGFGDVAALAVVPLPPCGSPSDITVSNDTGMCGATVTFMPPANSTCVPSSGTLFDVGTTSVTCTTSTIACAFTVTVTDDEDPTITCPDDIVVGSDAGQCGATVTWDSPLTSDNCPGETVSCSPASGSFFDVGVTQVTCTATDTSGNTAQCMFNVTVTDDEDPVPSCPADITTTNDAGQCGATVSFAATVVDNCPGATVSCSPASGTFFSTGLTVVTCTATDTSGNTTQCMFNVTVNDTEKPTIACPTDIVVNNDAGQCGATVNYTVPSGADNCGVQSVVCNPPPGFFPTGGPTLVTCTVTDTSGNTAQCMFNVTVNDTDPPGHGLPGYYDFLEPRWRPHACGRPHRRRLERQLRHRFHGAEPDLL